MMGVTYETAWSLFHRLRECAIDLDAGPIGGKARNAKRGKPPPKKQAVFFACRARWRGPVLSRRERKRGDAAPCSDQARQPSSR